MGSLRLVTFAGDPPPPPRCEVCDRAMWWHGGTFGWGCPVPGGLTECRSRLYRPMRPGDRRPLPYRERYPELAAIPEEDA